MERLTTDNPKGNFETLMNYCYDKDREAILQYAGGRENVPLYKYVAELCREKGCIEGIDEITLEEIDEKLCDPGAEHCDCPVGILYYLGAQAVQTRGMLKKYEDTGLTPEEIAPVMKLAEKMNVVDLVRENLRVSNGLWHTEAEITQLKADKESLEIELHNNGLYNDRLDRLIEANEKLKAQTAAIREAMEEATETIENMYGHDIPQTVKYRDVLNSVNTCDYHNPSDIAEIERIKGEIEDLEEDIDEAERELFEKIGRMEETLNKIADPIAYLRKDAEANGYTLDGANAILLIKDPNYYREIAKKAIDDLLGGVGDDIR
jgi:regulator of replication initiation timing